MIRTACLFVPLACLLAAPLAAEPGLPAPRESVAAQMAALVKLRRGQELGEIDLADLLLGERMVHDAFRVEAAARTEAMRAITRLRIDAHDLWLAD